jgi:hypothetical protein
MLRVRSSSADTQFFRLIKKALKTDTVDERARAFVKRLMQVGFKLFKDITNTFVTAGTQQQRFVCSCCALGL